MRCLCGDTQSVFAGFAPGLRRTSVTLAEEPMEMFDALESTGICDDSDGVRCCHEHLLRGVQAVADQLLVNAVFGDLLEMRRDMEFGGDCIL